ncbi:hypothetical protein BWQ96_05793 [Gracilariopsis chorda]|uniref:Uncharacterized protein n=1 Tax=Gracilariopsis chorda TaxID=448386 RepID=A0A2V3IQS4_9FLOR|nr:hypothetical protein BWQ96_05793 [Gracilariopsis chorda]|eukprot:PXF44465.1 hypothetical protein BWQ96_05793 [Gracilariopsis chorda]
MVNEVPHHVFYFEMRGSAPFLFLQFAFPELIKLLLTIIMILVMRRLYKPSRIEVKLLQTISGRRLRQLPSTVRAILGDRDMYIAVVAIVVRFAFWNHGLGKQLRYPPFATPVLYRVAQPLAPHLCFNGTSREKRDFVLAEAEFCSRTWKARHGWTAVQYVPAVYSQEYQKYSCLSPSRMISYGRITIDNSTYKGDGYVHDIQSLWSNCAEVGYDCSQITSVKTSENGTTWMMLSSPKARRLGIFILLRRPGRAALGEGYRAFNEGKSLDQILKIILSIDLELSLADCYDTKREVPVGEKSSHFYIDIRSLFSLVLLECFLYWIPFMRAKEEHENVSEAFVDLLRNDYDGDV